MGSPHNPGVLVDAFSVKIEDKTSPIPLYPAIIAILSLPWTRSEWGEMAEIKGHLVDGYTLWKVTSFPVDGPQEIVGER